MQALGEALEAQELRSREMDGRIKTLREAKPVDYEGAGVRVSRCVQFGKERSAISSGEL